MAQLKFYKKAQAPANAAAGAIWFDTTNHTIQVKTETGWDKYAGALNDATWDGLNLTITKHDGSSIVLNFSDFASASGVSAALNSKLAIGTTADAAGTQSYHGLKKDIEAAQAADKAAWEAAIAAKNVTASGDSLVGASAEGNKVTVAATTALTEAVGKANSAVQSVVEGDNNGEIKVDNTAVKVHGLGSAAFTKSDAYDAAGTAATAVAAITGTLASNDSKTLETINDELDAIDSEISSLKSGIAGTTRFHSVIKSFNGELPYIEDVPNDDGSYMISWYGANVEEGTLETNARHGDFFIILPYEQDAQSATEGKEYIFVVTEEGGPEFVELGDLTPANKRLSAIEASYVKSVATTDGTYVKLTPDAAAKNEVVVTIDDTALATKLGEIEDAIEGAVAGSVASIGGQAGIITLAAPTGDGDIKLSIGEDKQLKAEINNINEVIRIEVEGMLTDTPLEVSDSEDDLAPVSARGVKSAVASALTWVEFE